MDIRTLLVMACLSLVPVDAAAQDMCSSNMEFGNPGGADVTLCHDGYAAGYSYEHKIPMWCSYWVTREKADINVDRQDDFRENPSIPGQYSSVRGDYGKSGFDRGHCAPSASIDYTASANSETFFYTNMFPQLPGFNRDMFGHKGVWGFLENEVRQWAREKNRLYVISGAYVPEGSRSIGQGVAIPSHFFKVIVNPLGPEVIAFWMPHEEDSKYDASQYLVAIDFIEAATGLDILSLVQDEQEKVIEAKIGSKFW